MRRFRYAYLLASLMLVVFVRPFISQKLPGLAAVDVLLFVTLLSGVYAAVEQRRSFVAVALLGGCSVITQIVFVMSGSSASTGAFLIAALLFYGAVTSVMLWALFGEQRIVTRDTLYQAISVYLLLGMIGAMAYALLELASPGSFSFAGEQLLEPEARFDRFLGFSFTTLTTLGYGNIAPTSPRADSLTTLQAVIGQIYLTIVIARLVAMQVGQRSGESPSD